MRQARAKQLYDHLHTKFHTINGYTSPTFKILLADIARRAGHTVSEGDGIANPRWDWTENNPILKGKAEHSTGVAKSAGNLVNDDDRVRETRRDWFENNPVLKGEAGDGIGVVEEEDINNNEWEVEGADGEAIDDEDVTENRLDRYLEALEEDLTDLLEQVRMVQRGEEVVSMTRSMKRTSAKSLGGSCGNHIPKSCVLNRLKCFLMTA